MCTFQLLHNRNFTLVAHKLNYAILMNEYYTLETNYFLFKRCVSNKPIVKLLNYTSLGFIYYFCPVEKPVFWDVICQKAPLSVERTVLFSIQIPPSRRTLSSFSSFGWSGRNSSLTILLLAKQITLTPLLLVAWYSIGSSYPSLVKLSSSLAPKTNYKMPIGLAIGLAFSNLHYF